MDLCKILTELRQEREHMTQAINSLEQIEAGWSNGQGHAREFIGAVRKRGRPFGSKNKCAANPAVQPVTLLLPV